MFSVLSVFIGIRLNRDYISDSTFARKLDGSSSIEYLIYDTD